jgi:hypothetical protein
MKLVTLCSTALLIFALATLAGTPEQQKAFTDNYKAAMEGKDTATLESFLYTKGSDPEILEFYKMMQSGGAGAKISIIELVSLTPEDAKKASTPMDSPGGAKVCLPIKPTKKLVIKVEKKDAAAAHRAARKTSSLRRTANSSSPCRERVSNAGSW